MSLSRRSFLRRSFAGGAALAASSFLPGALGCQSSKPRRRFDFGSIEHVVVFMQENRSFDHYFGTLGGVRGYGDPHPLGRVGGGDVFGQPSTTGLVYPFRLDGTTTSGQCVSDVSHDYVTGANALHQGRNDGWVAAKGTNSLGYYKRADIPFHYALADAFTVCDHYFCSANTSTNPNRLYLWTASIDAAGRYEGPVMANDLAPSYTWTTYPERLQNAGVSWRVYQEIDNYDDNALAWFANFQNAATDSPLYVNGMTRRDRTAFMQDVMNDALPTVSWIIAPAALSEHPSSAPNKGADLTHQYLEALAQNPKVWEKTVFIYTMDENGGFYDHVVPPTPPPGTEDEFALGVPVGFGMRVPTVMISPFSTGGHVCSEVFDHTSILRFLELFTGVDEPNISAWRRRVSGDLTSAFDFRASSAAFPGSLPDTTALVTAADLACTTLPAAMPNGEAAAPTAETGARPLRPLPYQASADLEIDSAASLVRVRVRNDGTRTVVLSVHGLAGVDDAPRFATVDPGASDVVELPTDASTGLYDLEVHGPGSFYRRFVGTTLASAGEPTSKLVLDATAGTATLTVTNGAAAPIDVQLADALGSTATTTVAAGASHDFALTMVDRWYDASFTISGVSPASLRRAYAGHVEGVESQTLG